MKGTSPGRPKKFSIANSIRNEIKSLKKVDEKVDYLINFLLDNAQDKTEMFKIVKELLPYIKPKLQNVQTKSETTTKIEMVWVDDKDNLIDVTKKNNKDIEE